MTVSRTALKTVARLRKQALDEERQALVACLEREEQAQSARAAAAATLRDEQAAASSLDAPDTLVEAFAAWLPTGRTALAGADAAEERARASTIQARARVAAARASLEAAEQMLQSQAEAMRVETAKRLQDVLDEASQRVIRPDE